MVDKILEELCNKISIGDVFTLYEAIGCIEANATESCRNMLYSLKNVACKIQYKLMSEEQEAIKQALKERMDEVEE